MDAKKDVTFHVRINEGEERAITVKTGIYTYAAAACLAVFGYDELPVTIEIWLPSLLPEYGPYFYIADENEFGQLVMKHAVKR